MHAAKEIIEKYQTQMYKCTLLSVVVFYFCNYLFICVIRFINRSVFPFVAPFFSCCFFRSAELVHKRDRLYAAQLGHKRDLAYTQKVRA